MAGGGHTKASTRRYFVSSCRLEPSQCVRAKKQQPAVLTLISAHSPSSSHACLHGSRLDWHSRQPLPSLPDSLKLSSLAESPALISVVASAEVYMFSLWVFPHQWSFALASTSVHVLMILQAGGDEGGAEGGGDGGGGDGGGGEGGGGEGGGDGGS